jgi:hypothetical protein
MPTIMPRVLTRQASSFAAPDAFDELLISNGIVNRTLTTRGTGN